MSAAERIAVPFGEEEAQKRTRIFTEALGDLGKFCGLLQIVSGADVAAGNYGTRVPMRLTAIQRHFVQNRSGKDVVLKPRRVYITTVAAAEDLLFFLTRRGASVGIVLPSEEDQKAAREIEETIDVMLASLRAFVPHVAGIGPDEIIKTNKLWRWKARDARLRIVKAGASKRTAGNVGRALRFNRLHFTEVASYPEGAEMFSSILGAMPPTGGQVVLESTPKGNAGFFYDRWCDAIAGKGYRAHFYPWFWHEAYRLPLDPGEVIRPEGRLAELEVRLLEIGVPGQALKWYRAKLDEMGGDIERLKQEYPNDPESCFLGSGDQYIPNTLIEACMNYDPVPDFDGSTFGGVDFGRHNDLTSIITLKQDRAGRLWVVNVETCRRTDWDTQVATILATARNWGWKRCAVDATGMGSMPAEQIAKVIGERRVEQLMFNETVKEELATGGFAAIAERKVRLNDDQALVNDIRAIQRIVKDSGLITYDAPRTKEGHADRAWSLFLALRAAGIEPPRQTKQVLGPGDFANAYRKTT